AETSVNIGDICWIDASDSYTVKPASEFTWNASLSQTQDDFHTEFCGVAEQRYDADNPNAFGSKAGLLRVSKNGVYEFKSASARYKVNDLVGCSNEPGNLLENQKVALVATEALAIGRVIDPTTSSTRVKVR